MMEPTPDGHRAPIAELFKRNNTCRSVDTQTPVKAYSTNSSSGTKEKNDRGRNNVVVYNGILLSFTFYFVSGASSPCGSVSPSVWGVFDHHHSSSRPPSDGCTAEEIGMHNHFFFAFFFLCPRSTPEILHLPQVFIAFSWWQLAVEYTSVWYMSRRL